MRLSKRALAAWAVGSAAVLAAGFASPARAGSVQLGPLLRVQTPGSTPTTCPFESEPEITHTAAGTWVGYNDDSGCPRAPGVKLRLTGVQLIPAAGGPRRYIALPRDGGRITYYSGDPDLAPDPHVRGGALLASLIRTPKGLVLAVVRISPQGTATLLPSPSLGTSDDKEYLATDTGARSRYRGRIYLAWDDFDKGKITVRAFDGRDWLEPVRLASAGGLPDVAVAPNGDVAVAYSTSVGVSTVVSKDGGLSFSEPVRVLTGRDPGRDDPSCPLRPTIAQRQRASMSPHVAWDRRGRLHVVASLSSGGLGVQTGSVGAGTGGDGRVLHAVSTDRGESFDPPQRVGTPTAEVQWAPAIAVLPDGGVAVSYLQTAQTTSYDALVALRPVGAARFGKPMVLSEGHGTLPPATEAVGNSNCYGIGDYTGLAPTPDGVIATWPTTVGVQTTFVDSDIAVRAVRVTR